jgi:hypothetical protein
MTEMNDALRAEIARGWAASGLSQREYAALHSISERTLRSWIARFASRQPPVEQVRAIIMETIEKLQAVLDGLDQLGGMPDGDEVDDVAQGASDPTSIGMPVGTEDVPEGEEPDQPTAIVTRSSGPACPPAPLPRPRPMPAPAEPVATIKVHKNSYFYGL